MPWREGQLARAARIEDVLSERRSALAPYDAFAMKQRSGTVTVKGRDEGSRVPSRLLSGSQLLGGAGS